MRLLTAAFLMAAGFAENPSTQALPVPKLLNIGDPAPPLKVGKWIKGKPVRTLDKGRVYVVEFWATWCGAPCQAASAHLSELAAQYQGKVDFIGICILEELVGVGLNKEGLLAKVEKAVEKMGDQINYSVAADNYGSQEEDSANFMARNWFEAAGESGVPRAFVVGLDGKIAWIGHPSQLDGVLDDIVAGKFENADLAARRVESGQRTLQQRLQNREIMDPIRKPYRAGKFKEALEELEKLVMQHPTYKRTLALRRFELLLKVDEVKAYALARELAEGDYRDDALGLLKLARFLLNGNNLHHPDYRLALLLATKADTLAERMTFAFEKMPQLKPVLTATLARAQFKTGDLIQAVKTMKRAVDECETNPDVPTPLMKEMRSELEKYRQAADHRGAAAPHAAP